MYTADKNNRMIGLAVSTAMASVMLTGCAGGTAPEARVSAADSQHAMASGKQRRAIEHAEAAVLAEPRNAANRAALGQAYLDSGRFASAATSFQDAVDLGDTSTRTALSLALALTGEGRQDEANMILEERQGNIAAADLGLAMTLAGNPQGAIHVMSNAIRGGENTVKMRQNLAYSYAMAGRWREARLMAAQDVPADMLGDRMGEWAAQSQPNDYRKRLAALLDVPAGTIDNGQPVQLALANNPSLDQLAEHAVVEDQPVEVAAVSAEQPQRMAISGGELPSVGEAPIAFDRYQTAGASQPTNFASAFSSDAASAPSVAHNTSGFVRQPVNHETPASNAPRKENAVVNAPIEQLAGGTHLVQLGSFSSPQGAARAKAIYLDRYPELDGSQMVVTEAVVRGKRYWRVSAAGFDRASSSAMCGRVRSAGKGCIAWAEGRPLPGAVDTGVRLARR